MGTSLGATAKCEVHKMDAIGVDNCELPSTAMGFCAHVCRVVPELKSMPCFPEGTCLEKGTVPFLGFIRQDHTKLYNK